MPVAIVVGSQWGDEGKGKVIDFLTKKADLVVRFQGGNNAGHTVIVDGKKTALSVFPSGILRTSTRCLLSSGVVLDPEVFLEELRALEKSGIQITPERLGIAGEVPLIMPYHRAIDKERESLRKSSNTQIGTTGKGIGPAYEDSVSRNAIRVADLANHNSLKTIVERNVQRNNSYLRDVLKSDISFDASEIYEKLLKLSNEIVPYISNISAEVARAHKEGSFILFEGAQGTLLDINHGTYPFVTSSSTVAGYACVSAGFSPMYVDTIIGVCKAYVTRVGEGPFPTEIDGFEADHMRNAGKEFGTVTGRPRRCGWFDVVAAKKSIRINGIDLLFFVKLDILSGFEKIKIATHYLLDGKVLDDLPVSIEDYSRLEVCYEELDGWSEDLSDIKSFDDLPQQTKNFMNHISKLVNVEIGGFSVGPERNQTIVCSTKLKKFAGL